MNRRRLLKLFGGTLAAGIGGRYLFLPPSRSRLLAHPHDLAVRLFAALDEESKRRACVEYDHPFRQYHNRGVWGGGLQVNPLTLSWEARSILTDLFYAALSEDGRARVPNEFFTQLPGIHSMKLLICGDPSSPPYQIILTGAHLNLRTGGASREGVAFGGPLVYGDQRGDSRQGLPGNLYRYQFEIANRLFLSLRPEERRLALQETAPIQTQIDLQGNGGRFSGVPVGTLSPSSRMIARSLVEAIFSTYHPDDVAYAWTCLENNGGIEALHLGYYEDGEVDRSGEYQIFRLEGPAAVFYYRGYPHVHAFINVAMNGNAPLSVGELLGENPAVLEREGVRRLFEGSMRESTGADFAYYPPGQVAGRLRQGQIRAGDIYALESWQDSITVLEIKGAKLAPEIVEDLRRQDVATPLPTRDYSIAVAGDPSEAGVGAYGSAKPGAPVRDAVIAYLRKRRARAA